MKEKVGKEQNPNAVGMPKSKKPWKKLSKKYNRCLIFTRAITKVGFKKDTWEERQKKQVRDRQLRERLRLLKEQHNKEVLSYV